MWYEVIFDPDPLARVTGPSPTPWGTQKRLKKALMHWVVHILVKLRATSYDQQRGIITVLVCSFVEIVSLTPRRRPDFSASLSDEKSMK